MRHTLLSRNRKCVKILQLKLLAGIGYKTAYLVISSHLNIYSSIMFYLKQLWVAQNVRWKGRRLTNNTLERKLKAFKFRNETITYDLRKITKYITERERFPGRDANPEIREYSAAIIPT